MKSFLYAIWEILEVALIALIAVLAIRYFFVQPFLVSGASMEPTFSGGDYLLIDEISYRFREPQRGEVVVFKYPGDERLYYIKRIIGLPGEKVEIKNGKIVVNGIVLSEGYLPLGLNTTGKEESVVVGPDEYFVLGDNRNFSFDSRSWGTLSKSELIGLVRLRLWPPNEVMAFEKPVY